MTFENRPKLWLLPQCQENLLLVKDHMVAEARELFKDTGIHVCTEGTRWLSGSSHWHARPVFYNLSCKTKLMHGCVKIKPCQRLLWTNLMLLMQPSLMSC